MTSGPLSGCVDDLLSRCRTLSRLANREPPGRRHNIMCSQSTEMDSGASIPMTSKFIPPRLCILKQRTIKMLGRHFTVTDEIHPLEQVTWKLAETPPCDIETSKEATPGEHPILLNVTPLYFTLLQPTISGLSCVGCVGSSLSHLTKSVMEAKRSTSGKVLKAFVFMDRSFHETGQLISADRIKEQ